MSIYSICKHILKGNTLKNISRISTNRKFFSQEKVIPIEDPGAARMDCIGLRAHQRATFLFLGHQ